MKRTIISSLIATSALLSGTAQAANTVAGGTVNFVGELVTAACALDTSSANQTVQMGQIRTSTFTKKGSMSSPVGFKIVLTGCKVGATADAGGNTGGASGNTGGTGGNTSGTGGNTSGTGGNTSGVRTNDGTVTIGFKAVQESDDDTTISLTSGSGSAKNLGLRIIDSTGNPVKLDGTSSALVKLNDDRVEVPFNAAYIATDDVVTSGKANATAMFTLTYQ